jgi:hypothetical protein
MLNKLWHKLIDPSPERFLKKVAQAFRNEGQEVESADLKEFQIKLKNSLTINLANFYGNYCRCPWLQRKQALRQFLMIGLQHKKMHPKSWEEAAKLLVPQVKPAWVLDLNLSPEEKTMLRPISSDLEAMLALDHAEALSSVTSTCLKEWGVSVEQAWEQAIDNITARAQEGWQEIAPGIYMSPWHDCLDASRMLAPEIFHRLPIQGSPVLLCPDRNVMLVCSDRDNDALQALSQLGEHFYQDADRKLSGLVHRLDNRQWSLYEAPRGAPCAEGFARLRRRYLQAAYAELKRSLDQKGEDIFCATYMLFEKKGSNTLTSMAVWTMGTHSLLPQTDRVTFMSGPEGKFFDLPWEVVIERCGTLLTPTQHRPPLFEAPQSPSEELLKELRRLAEANPN